jgi:HEAT repeat protein
MANVPTDDGGDRLSAVEDLSGLDQPDAVFELVVALHDPSVRVREAAVDVLSALPSGSVCPQIVPLLSSENVSLRNYALEILESLGPEAEPHIIEATLSPDDDVRKFALDVLVKFARKRGDHSEAARQAVLRCFNDANVNVAGSAIEALGHTKNRDYLPLFGKILKSESPWMQCAAISSIVRVTGVDASAYFATLDRGTLSEEAQTFLDALLPKEASC